MLTSRPPYQPELDLPMPGRGEAPCRDGQEVEAIMARSESESLASTEHLMEAICDQDNIEAALDAVVRNKGAPGIDGITVKQLPSILKARWPEIEDQLLHPINGSWLVWIWRESPHYQGHDARTF